VLYVQCPFAVSITKGRVIHSINRSTTVRFFESGVCVMQIMRHNVQSRGRCVTNNSCCGKAVSIAYSERVSIALVIQQARRKRRVILS
jgi:hypothetical protein